MLSHLHRDRLHFRILLQTIFAEFPAYSRLLEAAERRARIEHVVTVHPNRAGANGVGDGERLLDVAGPYRRCQAIVRAIGPLNDFVHTAERNDTHHWAEDLFSGNLHVVLHVGKYRRLDKITAVAHPVTATHQLRAFTSPGFDVAHHLVELGAIYLRPLFGLGIEGIADRPLARPGAALRHKFVVDLLFHEHAR